MFDLDLFRVARSMPHASPGQTFAPLTTVWGEALDPDRLGESEPHPCPQLRRDRWRSLDGWWDYAIVKVDGVAGDGTAGGKTTGGNAGGDEDAGRGTPTARGAWHTATQPTAWDGRIVVPFSPEAPLSRVARQLQPDELLWYHRRIAYDAALGHRVLLHLDGVDWACAVWLDGKKVAEHSGAYMPFTVDATEALRMSGGACDLALCVYDPGDAGTQLRGKQRLDRGSIWYTAQSGIWKPVWLEEVPAAHITALSLHPDPDAGQLLVHAQVKGEGELHVCLYEQEGRTPDDPSAHDVSAANDDAASASRSIVAETDGPASDGATDLALPVPNPRLWSPEDPYLYDIELRFRPVGAQDKDVVHSYCAFRTCEVARDGQGIPRFFLNHRPLLLEGVLDQAYWPDGLLTPPSDDALAADVKAARDLGFNLIRLHIKIEQDRFYYHCDRLGMLVWQDMPSGGATPEPKRSLAYPTVFELRQRHYRDDTPHHQRDLGSDDPAYQAEWRATCRDAVIRLGNHPCVAAWGLFNESWGQFDAARMTEDVRRLDPTRPVSATSGWYDQKAGDFFDVHNYFRRLHVYGRDGRRAFVISEFGGLTYHLPAHSVLAQGYGYEMYDDAASYATAVDKLLGRVRSLWPHGLAGYVYTQLSDVEEETNGILTYDRRVNKLLLASEADRTSCADASDATDATSGSREGR